MLLFLNYVLTKVNLLNLEFQAEEFCLHTLFEQVYSTYKELLCCFVQETVTENEEICTINPRNEHVHVQTSEVYIGGRAEAQLQRDPLEPQVLQNFKRDCKNVLVELCSQNRRRFDLRHSGLLAKLTVLDPNWAQDLAKSPKSINSIAVQFLTVISERELDELEDEWRSEESG